MNSLSDPFIKRPVMTTLIYLSVVAFGIYSYIAMPVSDLPTVDYPVIQVSASYPGANPQVMADNIAAPLEQQLMQIPGIEVVSSKNFQGQTNIDLQFHLETSIDGAAADVQAAISKAEGKLPADLPAPPTFQKVNPNDFPVIFVGVISYSMTETQLYDYAFTQVAQRLQTVEGVASVNTYGSPRAVRIEVDPHKLYSRGLTMDNISQGVRQGTNLVSAGQIKGGDIQLTIKPQTQLEHAEDFANLIIAYKDGAPVFLKDVADCIDSLQAEDLQLSYWARGIEPGAAGVVLAVTKSSGANSVAVAKGVRDLLVQMQQIIPPSVRILPIYDRSVSIYNSVLDVEMTLLVAFVLVVMVVFLFLGRIGDTVIPAVALPMSLLMTFIVMHALDYSIDNLSLLALTLSVGFLIDDAIVFLENMVRHMEAGEDTWTAVFKGAKEISFTILAMTLSLASVFIPILGMSGLMGRVFRELAVTIIVAVISSGIVSLTLTPMMCARVLREHVSGKHTFFERLSHTIEDYLLKFYNPSLWFALKHWYLSVAAYALCGIGIWWFAHQITFSFLPQGDSSFVAGAWLVATDTSPKLMHQYQNKVIDIVRKDPDVKGFVTVSGFSARNSSNLGLMFIALDDARDRSDHLSIDAVTNRIKAAMAGIPGVMPGIRPRPVLNISVGATNTTQGKYAYVISGLDRTKVYASATALTAAMMQSGKFSSVQPDLYPDNRELQLKVNRNQASTYGVPMTDFTQILTSAYSQNYSYLIKSDYQQYWVVVEAAPQFRSRIGNLNELYFDSRNNQSPLYNTGNSTNDALNNLVAFQTVAKPEVKLGPLQVNHYNGFTSVTLSYDLNPGVSIGDATNFVEQTAATLMPSGVTGAFQGDALIFRQTFHSMALMLIVALFVMYIILGILYESFIHPLTVLLSVPVAMVGGLATLYFFNMELSLFAFIGFFLLAGLVKKNGIMMIDFAVARQAEGMKPEDAVHEACMERFRPIMMTTLAAFFGSLPLAIGLGADAASRMPLGLTICGGLMISQVVTLFVTPVTYLVFEWIRAHFTDKAPGPMAAPALASKALS